MAKWSLFDLEHHFSFYGAYHSNPTNVLIHMIFVWPILFTALLILYFTPPLSTSSSGSLLPPNIELPSLFGIDAFLVFNVGFLLTVIYGVFYICLDKKAGSLAAIILVFCLLATSYLGSWLGFSTAWKVVVIAQIVCWTGQFIGHGVCEKRAPALLDNLVQAFVMAPFFVLLEALQTGFGYEPYPGFQATVQAKVDAEISEWKEKKGKKLA